MATTKSRAARAANRTRTAIGILVGEGLVIEQLDDGLVSLFGGPYVGVPASEVLVDHDNYLRIFRDVLATGVDMRVDLPFGVLWVFRSKTDPDCVVAHYEHEMYVGLYYERKV